MFLNQTTYSTGNATSPYSVAVVDVNSDNQPDIVVVNEASNNVNVFLNAGNGTFLNQTTYLTGSSPRTVAVVDVNNDTKPDIIVANYGSTYVSILLNAGNGTFLTQTTRSTGGGSGPYALAVVDVNSDNKPDIVVAYYSSNNVGVFLNAGNATFLNQTTYSIGNGSLTRSVAVADVNGDNQPDIVVTNTALSSVGVLLNAGNGTFLNQTTYSTGNSSSPYSVAVVDVNSDNQPDIIVANLGTSKVGVFLNAGNGMFLSQTTYSTGTSSSPRGVAVTDVNSDGQPDIVVADSGSGKVGVLLNAGNGTFLNQTTYSTGNPLSVAVADVNNDNKSDIVVANDSSNTVGVLLHC
jgi:hypothetical protein